MRYAIFLIIFIFFSPVSTVLAFDNNPLHMANVGVFAPDSYELCRPTTTVLATFEEAGYCLKDEVVVPDEDFVVPVSVDLASYTENRRAIRAVERNIELYTGPLKKTFTKYLSRSGKYIRMMKNIMKEEGLPEDMAYLPLVESGFNTKAYSRKRAAGPWQFISATGKRYGLRVDWWVDERRDPVKSTRAAARYLKDLHDMFGSWSLAMAAYNAGEGKVRRALGRTRNGNYWSLLSTRHIRRETKNYVPNFIAARLIAIDPGKYGFLDVAYESDYVFDEVELQSPLTLDVIAKCAESNVNEIKDLNPELRRWSTPPDVQHYRLRIPRGMREKFLLNLSKIPEGKRFTVHVYHVRRGDTVSEIANNTGVPQRVIISYNKLNRRGFITVGQKLLIPVGLAAN
jgi:membrane-bound lytic murein transglycosylase D